MGDLKFDDFFEMEFDRINPFFKVNKAKGKKILYLLGFLAAVEFILLAIIPHTQKQAGFMLVTYDARLWMAIKIVFIITLIVLLWIGLCLSFEKIAYKKASIKYRDYSFYQQTKLREENALRKMTNDN